MTKSTTGAVMPGPDFEPGRPLPARLLYRRCDPAELPFALCSELEEAPGLIGQERAVEAIQFAMRMRRKSYNVYALGASGTGRHGMIEDLLRARAQSQPTPPDWCYVNNFADPQQPRRLQLPPGRGAALAAAMKRLVKELRAALPAAFERDEYGPDATRSTSSFKQRSEGAVGALQQQAEEQGIALIRTPMGFGLAPRREGKVLTPDLFEALPADEREHIGQEIEGIQKDLEAIMRQAPLWEREHGDALQALNRETTGFAIAHLMEELRAGFAELPEVGQYLDAVEHDIKENADDFLPAPPVEVPAPGLVPQSIAQAGDNATSTATKYNIIVDNGARQGAPVVYEDNPTHQTLVGRVSIWRGSARSSPISTCWSPVRYTGPMAAT